jgi:hypothetical protein
MGIKITTAGLGLMAALAIGQDSSTMDYVRKIGVGTSSTAVSAADTELGGLIATSGFSRDTSIYLVDTDTTNYPNTAKMSIDMHNDTTAVTVAEAGAFSRLNNVLFCRYVPTQSVYVYPTRHLVVLFRFRFRR